MDLSEVVIIDLDQNHIRLEQSQSNSAQKKPFYKSLLGKKKSKFSTDQMLQLPEKLSIMLQKEIETYQENLFVFNVNILNTQQHYLQNKDDSTLQNGFLRIMAHLLKDYDQYTSMLLDELPVFNIVECLKTKAEEEKGFYFQFFNT